MSIKDLDFWRSSNYIKKNAERTKNFLIKARSRQKKELNKNRFCFRFCSTCYLSNLLIKGLESGGIPINKILSLKKTKLVLSFLMVCYFNLD